MSEQTGIQTQTRPAAGIERVKNYMMSQEVKDRFTEMMGPDGNYYLNQVMMVVAGSQDLQNCDPASILISAVRAATLKLSVDPTSGQAWIIPYNGKATFQLGYKGIYDLAMRTGRYKVINVAKIYEGQVVVEDQITGVHRLEGAKTSDRVAGWMLYFELVGGFSKSFYMTVEEIAAHAEHYSKAYHSKGSKWNDPFERWKMERKTVLVNGLRQFGVFSPTDKAIIDGIEREDAVDAEISEFPAEDEVTPPTSKTAGKSAAQLEASLGFDPDPVSEKPWIDTTVSMEIAKSEAGTDKVKYWDMSSEEILKRLTAVVNKLQQPGLPDGTRDAYLLKKDVMSAILDYRDYRSEPEEII